MKSGGQRQDLAFLALAVAVLAIAVALFVGMKSFPKQQPRPVETEQPEQVAAAEPAAEPPGKEATARDPFRSQTAEGGPTGPAAGPRRELKLVGIVRGGGAQATAVIHSGRRRYYAKVGDRAAGYTVESIGTDHAILARDEDRMTLVLREPEPEE
jgi:hypothetical protein